MLPHIYFGLLYAVVQYWHFMSTGKHIYSFLGLFGWPVLVSFEIIMTVISILSDYFLSFAIEHKQHELEESVEKRQIHEGH